MNKILNNPKFISRVVKLIIKKNLINSKHQLSAQQLRINKAEQLLLMELLGNQFKSE